MGIKSTFLKIMTKSFTKAINAYTLQSQIFNNNLVKKFAVMQSF